MDSGRSPGFYSTIPLEFRQDRNFTVSVNSSSFVNFNRGRLAIKSTSPSSGRFDVATFGAVVTFDSVSGRLVIHKTHHTYIQPTFFEGTLFIPRNAEMKDLLIDADWLNLEIDQNVRLKVYGCGKLKTNSGDIQAHPVAARLVVSSGSGTILISSAPPDHCGHYTKLSTVSGGIYADMVLDHDITIKSVSGCINGNLHCPGTFRNYNTSIKTETVSGQTNIKITNSIPDMGVLVQGDNPYNHEAESTISPSTTGTRLVNGFLKANRQSTSGDIFLEYPGALAGSVSIQTTSGMQIINETRQSGGVSKWRSGTGVENSAIEAQSTSGDVRFLTKRNDLMCLKPERDMGSQFNGIVFGSVNGSMGFNMHGNITTMSSSGDVMTLSGNGRNFSNIWGGTSGNAGTVWRDNVSFLNRNHDRQTPPSADDFEAPPPRYEDLPPPPYDG